MFESGRVVSANHVIQSAINILSQLVDTVALQEVSLRVDQVTVRGTEDDIDDGDEDGIPAAHRYRTRFKKLIWERLDDLLAGGFPSLRAIEIAFPKQFSQYYFHTPATMAELLKARFPKLTEHSELRASLWVGWRE